MKKTISILLLICLFITLSSCKQAGEYSNSSNRSNLTPGSTPGFIPSTTPGFIPSTTPGFIPSTTPSYSDTSILIGETYFYDDGRTITTTTNSFGLPEKTIDKLNNGTIMTINYYYDENALPSSFEFVQKYDSGDTAKVIIQFDFENNRIQKTTYLNNEELSIAENKFVHSDLHGSTRYGYEYEYDSNRNITKEIDPNNQGCWTEYRYDPNGNVKQILHYENSRTYCSFTTSKITKLTEPQKGAFETVKVLLDLDGGWELIK